MNADTKRLKYRLGEIFTARDIPIDPKSGGKFIALDIKHHVCAGLFVWKMSDADRSPEVEKAVTDFVAAGNSYDNSRDLLRPAVDEIFNNFDSLTRNEALGLLVAALAKGGAA